jgi:streptomycin 6-kinase
VKVLAIDGVACLMEDAGKVTLRQLHQDMGEPAANKVLAMTLPALFAPPSGPYPQDLPDMHTHFSALLEFDPESHPSHFARSMRFAAETAQHLLNNQHDIRPLHGDIHHDNIVTQDGTRWLAIDPQGLIGDPHYDVANLFGNPDGNRQLLLDPQRASNLADMLSAVLDLNRRRILEFALAHCGVSIAWSLKDGAIAEGENAEERLRLIPMLRSLLSNDQSKTDP